jgi:hypothetical protein
MKTRFNTLRSAVGTLGLALLVGGVSAAEITIYTDPNFSGNASQLKRSEGYVASGAARSVRVATGVWEACTGANFSGTCVRLTPGDYRQIGDRWGVSYASFREVSSYGSGASQGSVQLFARGGYRGISLQLDQEMADLSGEQFVFAVGSARVAGALSWEICSEPYYRGRCQVLPPGDHGDVGRMIRDRIASARPVYPRPPVVESSPGLRGGVARIELYTGTRYTGASRAYNNDATNLSRSDPMFNDSISSIRVTSGEWELCQHPNFSGSCLVFGPGEYQVLPPQLQRQITSMRPVIQSAQNIGSTEWLESLFGGVRHTGQLDARVFSEGAPSTRHPIWLFEGREFAGRSLRTRNDIPDLRQYQFNDTIGSVFVTHGTWELCQDLNYAGRCYTARPGQHFELPFGRNGVTSIRRVSF